MGLGRKRDDEALRLKRFEKLLGYRFKRRAHLKRALTHKSFANEERLPPTEHNERYEFLGDAVLELAISHLLMEQFPTQSEGELSKLRAAVVNEEELAAIARRIELGSFLYVGKGEEQTGGRDKPSLLSDAFEAVLGAVYLDRGFSKALVIVDRQLTEALRRSDVVGFARDYKTRLQEVSQARFRAVPRYRLVKETGPDHCKTFEISIAMNGKILSTGHGASKKAAEQDAARQALEQLERQGNDGL